MMKVLLRLFVFLIISANILNLQAQYKTGLNSGNFKFTTSAGAGFISFEDRARSQGFKIPYAPGVDDIPSTVFQSCLTFAGYIDGSLHVHMNRYVPDFRLGPVLTNGEYPDEFQSAFDTIWVIKRQEIQRFLEDFEDGEIDDDHPAVFGWPAKGNKILLEDSIALPDQDLAPFYDRNNNGRYEPILGEYPSHNGNLSMKLIPTYISWSVYNTGKTHYNLLGNIEVQTTAYAYACENSTALNNAAYFKLKLFNRNPQEIHQFKIPISFDGDLGCETHDYWGTDTVTESIYFYQDTAAEKICESARLKLPKDLKVAQSLTLLDHKIDASNDYAVNRQLIESPPPIREYEFNEVVSGRKLNGLPIPYGWGTPLEDLSDTVTRIFTDRPMNSEAWNMVNSQLNTFTDYRPYATLFVDEFKRNEDVEINLASVASYDSSGSYDNYTIVDKLLDEDVPIAIQAFKNDFTSIECNHKNICNTRDCVWPGDSNNDERVFLDDFIHTGWLIKEQNKGNKRIYQTRDWLPFHCDEWGVSFKNTDLKHADASGNGQIQANDLRIIEENFQMETPQYTSSLWRGPIHSKVPLKIQDASVVDYRSPFLRFVRTKIKIGSETFPVEDLHSICFTIEFEDDIIDIEYSEENYLGESYSGININPALEKFSQNEVHIAITDLQNNSYSGNFTVAEFKVGIIDDLTTNDPSGNLTIDMGLKNVRALRKDGTEIPLSLEEGTLTIKNVDISTASTEETKPDVSVYPNPVQDVLYLSGTSNDLNKIKIISLDGSQIITRKLRGNSINTSDLESGLYLIELQSDNYRHKYIRFVKL